MTTTKKVERRGRPPKMDRDAATEAAMRLFWQRGYDSVGIAELSETIGVQPPSLYKTFGSKLGLLEAAAQHYAVQDGRFVTDIAPEAKSARDLVARVLLGAADAYSSDPQTRGCLILDGTRNSADRDARALMWDMRSHTRDFMSSHLKRVGARDPQKLAEFILVAMTGLSGSARDGVDRETLQECAVQMASIVAANIQ